MQRHPVEQVGELAHTAPYPLFGHAVLQHHAREIAPFRGASPHQPPEGKGFAGGDEDAVHTGGCQSQTDCLIVLQPGVHLSKCSADEGIVGINQMGQRLCLPFAGKSGARKGIFRLALDNIFLHRQLVCQR